jgi:glycosyltransferase involved in cell wall biosynthesis
MDQSVSVIVPTFNGALRIGKCLTALLEQKSGIATEIVVVNDGSTDNTADVVLRCPGVRLVNQAHAGPAAARNRGVLESKGAIILFTDDDCVPQSDWLNAMLAPFHDPEVVGAKGTYRTTQRSLIARFVQIEYEDRYHRMTRYADIDFIDTYSAAFRRDRFLEAEGYDTSFPTACAEDVDLSYRMSVRGWKMKFAPAAVVYHTHPDTLSGYLKKKYKFAFWRISAVKRTPDKVWNDAHTPQLMKLQVLLAPILLCAAAFDIAVRPAISVLLLVIVAFLMSTVAFVIRATRKDPLVGAISPVLIAARSLAQLLGVIAGVVHSYHRRHHATEGSALSS